jgi:HK97 family phage major capsid protein
MAIISRSNAEALIPEEVSKEIFQSAVTQSAAMSLMRRLPNMSRKQERLPVLSALLSAYFVTGEAGGSASYGYKAQTSMAWANKYIYAEELAVIVPIPDAVIDDSAYDIWGEVKGKIGEAFGATIDAAIFHGTNAPALWPDDIVTAATAAGNAVALGTGPDIYEDIMGEGGSLATVEADGYMVTGHVGHPTLKAKLRGLRDANGCPIFSRGMQAANTYELDGAPILFPVNGGLDPTAMQLFSGQWNQLVYSIRQDLTFKVLTEATLTDGAGNIVYNLAEQDMTALRCVMRLGWQCPNPINRLQPTEGNRYPVAVLTPAA